MPRNRNAVLEGPLDQKLRIILMRGDRFVAVEVDHLLMDTIRAMETALIEEFKIARGTIHTIEDIDRVFAGDQDGDIAVESGLPIGSREADDAG